MSGIIAMPHKLHARRAQSLAATSVATLCPEHEARERPDRETWNRGGPGCGGTPGRARDRPRLLQRLLRWRMHHPGRAERGAKVFPGLIAMARRDSRPHVLMSWFMDDWGR